MKLDRILAARPINRTAGAVTSLKPMPLRIRWGAARYKWDAQGHRR
jgi:hypothetical protein